jgi:hypothetical protein
MLLFYRNYTMKTFIIVPILLIVFSCTSLNPEEMDKQEKLGFIEEIIYDPDNFESIYLKSKFLKKKSTYIDTSKRPTKTQKLIDYIKDNFIYKKFFLEKKEVDSMLSYYKKKFDSEGIEILCDREYYFIRSRDNNSLLRFIFGNCSEDGKWKLLMIKRGEPKEYENF